MRLIKKGRKINLIISTFLAFTLLNIIENPLKTNILNTNINLGQQALAKKAGGRSGGGSFKGRSSSPSNRGGSTNNTFIFQRNSYGGGYGYDYGLGGDLYNLILLIILCGFFLFIIYENSTQKKAERDTITLKKRKLIISKLQIALTAEAKEISQQLSQLTLDINTNIKSGLVELLQESLVILLRNREYWSHVLSRSFLVRADKAEAKFNRFSINQRSKFSREAITNVNGIIRKHIDNTNNDKNAYQNSNLSGYIVVTILVASAGDKPLFNQVRTSEELKAALEKLAAINRESLMKLEVLWIPQSADESLTNDEFIMEYTDMIEL